MALNNTFGIEWGKRSLNILDPNVEISFHLR